MMIIIHDIYIYIYVYRVYVTLFALTEGLARLLDHVMKIVK